jgi:poly-gamma-glutamate synthase PgsB/CapB
MLYEPAQFDEPPVTLRACLPDLVVRLDAGAVEAVEEALETTRVGRSRLSAVLIAPYAEISAQHRLWRGLLAVAGRVREQLGANARRFQQLSEEYFSQLPGQAREDVLVGRVTGEAGNRLSGWLDVRAVRSGFLDFDAYAERHARRQAELVARVRVCLLGVERLLQDLFGRLDEDDHPAVVEHLSSEEDTLFDFAVQEDYPELAWLALRAVSSLLRAAFERSESVSSRWINHLIRTAVSPKADPWRQRTALTVLAFDPDSAVELLQGRLERPVLAKDDWFVQAHCARLLARIAPDEALDRFERYVDREGDAVRMAICEAVAPIDDERAVTLLADLARPTRPPKVRAAAGRGLAQAALRGTSVGGLAVQELARAFLEEPEVGVLARAADELRRLLRSIAEDRPGEVARVAVALRDVLGERLASEPDAAVSNEITGFRLELARLADADPGPGRLERKLRDLQFGEVVRESRDVPKETVSRAMASAARRGFGLYARRDRLGRWVIRRGERFRTRLWRVVHEMRHPAPTKRQGHRHTRARVFDGWLRAHPHSLGEVTPTTVPGERRQVGDEGGWGPYLPLVDDILDAQLRGSAVEITTPAGTTLVEPPAGRLRRWKNAIAISLRYREFDDLRLASIQADDEARRSRFLATMRERFDTRVRFQPHFQGDPAPPSLRMLVARADDQPLLEGEKSPPQLPAPPSLMLAAPTFAQEVAGILRDGAQVGGKLFVELFERGGVRIQNLAIVIVALLASFLFRMVWVRITFDRWRRSIPLSIGGWGTRGKSGTERLKAALFHGLGYDVFVKTTGCEAMFIHAPRRLDALETFIYRPYDKASIWEQRDMVKLGKALGSDVFLWECMALTPRYVTILQRYWMRDDLVTLTNAYPDHEDVQGPAGIDVAETIGRFIPHKGKAITTEREMLPVFERIAAERKTELVVVDERGEFSIPDDMLERFPYREHPRNIALVAEMAEQLGIDRDYAIFAMADRVVPDLGVLKEYPAVNVLGREVRFINGCSANERAGFMNNWERMQLDAVGADPAAKSHVVTIVNNRGDRVSRSIVFADILVRDVTADRHLLIGTNIAGLRNYIDDSLDRYLANVSIVEEGDDRAVARKRLDELFARVRIRPATGAHLQSQLRTMADACRIESLRDCSDELDAAIDELAATRGSWAQTCAHVAAHPTITSILESLAEADERPADALAVKGRVEEDAVMDDLSLASTEELEPFFVERVACVVLHRALRRHLDEVLEDAAGIEAFHERVRKVWRERFLSTVVSVDDPDASGDSIIVSAVRVLPPGFSGVLMGTQNIKGTGLDFVYRWVDLEATTRRLDAMPSAGETEFSGELMWLRGTATLHLTEALVAWRRIRALPRQRKCSPRELALIERATSHLAELAAARFSEASESNGSERTTWRTRFLAGMERLLDPFDAIWRRYRAERLLRLLAARRISHPRISEEMRKLVKRQKGGWLAGK